MIALHEIGYWIVTYHKAGDPGWEFVLGWNLAIAGLAAAGSARERTRLIAIIDTMHEEFGPHTYAKPAVTV